MLLAAVVVLSTIAAAAVTTFSLMAVDGGVTEGDIWKAAGIWGFILMFAIPTAYGFWKTWD